MSSALSASLRPDAQFQTPKMQHNSPTGDVHTALIEQVLTDVRELRREFKDDRRELWKALNGLRESITGNSREGLSMRVDRNTRFRRNIVKMLWVLFTPLYAGLIALLLKTLLNQ